MMLNLSEKQRVFLKEELGLTIDQIEAMNKESWREVREHCYNIVLDEMLDDNDNYKPEGDGSERCSIASTIMDMKFGELRTPK